MIARRCRRRSTEVACVQTKSLRFSLNSFTVDSVMYSLSKRSMQLTVGRNAAWGCVYSTTTNQAADLIPVMLPSHSSPRFGSEKEGGTG